MEYLTQGCQNAGPKLVPYSGTCFRPAGPHAQGPKTLLSIVFLNGKLAFSPPWARARGTETGTAIWHQFWYREIGPWARLWVTARATRAGARWICKGGFAVASEVHAGKPARPVEARIRRRAPMAVQPPFATGTNAPCRSCVLLWRQPPLRGDPAKDNATSCGAAGVHTGSAPVKEAASPRIGTGQRRHFVTPALPQIWAPPGGTILRATFRGGGLRSEARPRC